ncbi:hypothetical protein B0A55_10632 [Friedmanniomyces simplex]|uniref:Uncharacterized protein n=1 Tax=Friedmanniomyces simplex TaxID=329884 RepID=A0A4V5NDY3_9PEZI|nr:hypothetical protein B0A55_10632 [Friedmanniomyces simplex]
MEAIGVSAESAFQVILAWMVGLRRLSADFDIGNQVSINIWVFAVPIAIVLIKDRS